jgi:dTDP-4-dehydrorhamnose 3,5-epimerase
MVKTGEQMTNGIKDAQTASPNGRILRDLIDGVQIHEMPNIITRNGVTTEVVRPEWEIGRIEIRHMIHVSLHARAITAWHCHQLQTDRIFVTEGTLRVVLFDDRAGSPTQGKVNELHLSRFRPSTLLIPPFVWHGIQNIENQTSGFINFFDRAYCYENPDEWRLPMDTDAIPYRFDRN